MSEQGTIVSFDSNDAIPSGQILHARLPDEPETLFFLISAVRGPLQQRLLDGGGIGTPVLFDRNPGSNEATNVVADDGANFAFAKRSHRPVMDFRRFRDSVQTAVHADYVQRPGVKVANEQAFEEMKNYVSRRYARVDAAHSFVDAGGQVFDCIPIADQPSLQGKPLAIAAPRDVPTFGAPDKSQISRAASSTHQLDPRRQDRFGNAMSCPEGTIAVRRITLGELSRHDTLHNFFRKTPFGKGRHPRLSPPEIAANVHKYAHAYQTVDNLGGHSFVNIWDPTVGSQVFSLSQHWYAGGNPVQTVECGWQVFPEKYGTTLPVLFIYWTADNYNQTGNYNLDQAAFVQTNSNWALGGALNTISAAGGQQFELEVTWNLQDGNWWLFLQGTSAENAVGYYPTALFHGGQLATKATDIDYGGEVVDTTAWPPMGSGAFASAGNLEAAYHRNIYYLPDTGGALNTTLAPSELSPSCFTITLGRADDQSEFFYFGGPGGGACE